MWTFTTSKSNLGSYKSLLKVWLCQRPEPPCPIGTFQRQGRRRYLLSSVPCPCPFVSRCVKGAQQPRTSLQKPKPSLTLFQLPFHFREKGHRMNTSASCLLGLLAGTGACSVPGLLLKRQALGVSCCLIYIKGRIKFSYAVELVFTSGSLLKQSWG